MNRLKIQIKKIIEQVTEEDSEILANPIDHAAAVGGEPVVDEPEVIDHSTGEVVKISDRKFSMKESDLRSAVRKVILKSM